MVDWQGVIVRPRGGINAPVLLSWRRLLPHGKMTPRDRTNLAFVASRQNDTEAYSGFEGKPAVPKWGSAAASRCP